MENGAAGRDSRHPVDYCPDVSSDLPARTRETPKPKEGRPLG